jgi:hypothetical protein
MTKPISVEMLDEFRRVGQQVADEVARERAPRLHHASVDCWCSPTWQPGAKLKHHTTDGSPAEFEPADGDAIDADGYSAEDHR